MKNKGVTWRIKDRQVIRLSQRNKRGHHYIKKRRENKIIGQSKDSAVHEKLRLNEFNVTFHKELLIDAVISLPDVLVVSGRARYREGPYSPCRSNSLTVSRPMQWSFSSQVYASIWHTQNTW